MIQQQRLDLNELLQGNLIEELELFYIAIHLFRDRDNKTGIQTGNQI